MSGDSFLSRWTQRKQAVREAELRDAAARAEPPAPVMPADEAAFDPATLPPIESLTAESDFSVFLAKGVPEALRRQALRKLWLTEPSVLEYKPLVEYNWDFTAPGYGDLLPTDDIKKLVQHILPDEPAAEAGEDGTEQPPALPQPETPATGTGSVRLGPVAEAEPAAEADAKLEPARLSAPQPSDESPPRRRHGGALPA